MLFKKIGVGMHRLTTSMSTCSDDNAERNLFNASPAMENALSGGVDEPGMHKYLIARGTRRL